MLGSRPERVAAVVVVVVMTAVGFLPLFGGPGYEHALATGLIVPSAAAIAVSLDLSRKDLAPFEVVRRGVVRGFFLAAVSFATAIVHGLRTGFCDVGGALLAFAMTAGVGSVMGGAWGAVVSEIARKRKRRRLACVLLSLALPLVCIALSFYRFVTSPMIFAFDPFVGYFSGTLYDTVIEPGTALVTYRVGSAFTLASLALFASVCKRDRGLKTLPLRGSPEAKTRLFLAVLFAAGSLGIAASGSRLGHFSTEESIAKELGGRLSGERCDVVYPSSMRPEESRLLAKDCEEELASVERVLGARGPSRVTAFFFKDANQKKCLMGAAHTYIAKPWRHEVYLQTAPYPHPVLGHELAHVVAGSFGRGPFRIAGELGGLFPNPGLIEGIAVAASPDDDDLTDMQWARAMMDLGILPPIERLFSMGFFGETSEKSYTLAGAFADYCIDRFGAKAVRAWYGGTPIEVATGQTWEGLDRDFRASLAKLSLSSEAGSFAQAKFQKPGVFGRTCPHVVDELRRDAEQCRDAQQVKEAIALYTKVLARDPHDTGAAFARAAIERRWGDAARGRAELAAIAADLALPRTWRDKSEEALADGDFIDGRTKEAAARYKRLASLSLDEDAARTLEVKAIGAEDPVARPAIRALLLGDLRHPSDVFLGAVELGAWEKAPNPGPLVDYLIGRNLVQRGFYDDALTHLERAASAPLPTPRVARENIRQQAIAACAMSDTARIDKLEEALQAFQRAPGEEKAESPFFLSFGGRRAALGRLLSRCK